MLRTNHTWRIGLLALALAFGGCGTPDDPTDGGTDGEDGGLDQCAVDNSRVRPAVEPDWALTPGGEAGTGFICPRGDVDHFWFTVASPGTILTVELSNNVSMSPVDLCYKLMAEDEGAPLIGGLCDHDGMDGTTELRGRHYLAAAGTYFLEVRDEAGDEQDTRNAYLLELSQVVDPDQNEANNDRDHATPLSGSTQGYISFLGDQDWFAVQVNGSGQILSIDLTTAAASPVDLRYTLYAADGTTPINTGADGDGSNGPTALNDVLSVAQPGTFYLVVTDENHDESDLDVGYNLQIQLMQNPDPRDRSGNNDLPQAATPITSGVAVGDAYLATRADQDWYRIESPGVTDANPALLEIELVFNGSTTVDPAIDLIVGDPNTPCNQGDACETLSWSCGGGNCTSAECRNAQCPSHECVEHLSRCSGAGFCLPEGGCGIRHLVMRGAEWSTSGSPRHLHTLAPMYGSVYYILVRDFMGDDLDPSVSYSLTVTVRSEPDQNERPPNGLYQPYGTDEMEEETRDWNKPKATQVACSDLGDHVACGPISGYLSFRGDQDWFVLNSLPTEDEAVPLNSSTKIDYDLQYEYSFSGAADLYVNYEFFLNRVDRAHSAFNHLGPSSGIVGDGNPANGGVGDDCAYMCGEYHGGRPVYIRIQHSDRKKWDYNNPYNLTVRAYRRCPLECEWCAPDAVDYACPTPDNPCPGGGC